MDKFEKMVEDMEAREDIVECKECFDLFPKAECAKQPTGWICPTCKSRLDKTAHDLEPSTQDLTVDLYDHDFPEVTEYDDSFEVRTQTSDDLGAAFDSLIKDEYDSLYQYEAADETVQHASIDEKRRGKIIDALAEIREDKEEAIDTLKDLAAGGEAEDVDEAIATAVPNGLHNPLGAAGSPVTLMASADAETPVGAEGETDLTEDALQEGPWGLASKVKDFAKGIGDKLKGVKSGDYGKIIANVFHKGYKLVTADPKLSIKDVFDKAEIPKDKQYPVEYLASDFKTADQSARIISKYARENGFPNLQIYVVAKTIDTKDLGWVINGAVGKPINKDIHCIICSYLDGNIKDDRRKKLAEKLLEAARDSKLLGEVIAANNPDEAFKIAYGEVDDESDDDDNTPPDNEKKPGGDDKKPSDDDKKPSDDDKKPSDDEDPKPSEDENDWSDEFDDLDPATPVTAEVVELLDSLLGGTNAKYYFRIFEPSGKISTKQHGPLQKLIDFFTTGKGKAAKATIFFPIDLLEKTLPDKAAKVLEWFDKNMEEKQDVSGQANPRGSVLLTTYEAGKRIEDGDDNLTTIIKKFAELKAIVEGDLGDDFDDLDDEEPNPDDQEKKTDDDVSDDDETPTDDNETPSDDDETPSDDESKTEEDTEDLEELKNNTADSILDLLKDGADYTEDSYKAYSDKMEELLDRVEQVKTKEELDSIEIEDAISEAEALLVAKSDETSTEAETEEEPDTSTTGKLKKTGGGKNLPTNKQEIAYSPEYKRAKERIRHEIMNPLVNAAGAKTAKDLDVLIDKIKAFMAKHKSEFVFEAYKRRLVRECAALADEAQKKTLTEAINDLNYEDEAKVDDLFIAGDDWEALQAARAECEDGTCSMTEEYRRYANEEEAAAVESVLNTMSGEVSTALAEARRAGYVIEVTDEDGYMYSEDTYSHRWFIMSPDFFEDTEAKGIENMLATAINNAVSKIALPYTLEGLAGYVSFPDEDLMLTEEEASEGTAGMITVDMTFARALF